VDKPPQLLAGEVFVLPNQFLDKVSLFDDVLHPSKAIAPKAELGDLWVTNFRTILRFSVSCDGSSSCSHSVPPHAPTLFLLMCPTLSS
jgi:hypothetical protein